MAGKKGKSDNTQASGGKGKGKGKQDSTQADKAAPAKNKNAQTIDVCHILCEKFSQREAAYEELTNGTLSWKGACEKYSVDKARSGGSLGKKSKNQLLAEFSEVAFQLPSMGGEYKGGEDGYPYGKCKTDEGYHLIMVKGKA